MPAMMERAVPYMALAKRVAPMGATMTFLSVMVIVTTGANVFWTWPLGPSTRTVVSLMSTLTFSGMGTGCLPMRLMVGGSLPDVADEFAAGLVAAAVGVLHQALGRRDDADPQAVQDPRDVMIAEIEPAAGRRHPVQSAYGRGAVNVLHLDDERLVAELVGAPGVAGDEALGPQDFGDALLDLRVRHMALHNARLAGVAQAREKVADRIGHGGCCGILGAARVISDSRGPGGLPGSFDDA